MSRSEDVYEPKKRRMSKMIQLHVALPNGHDELLTLLPSSTVQDLKTKAQRAFGRKCLRLITAKKQVLVHFEQTMEEAEIKDGECLTALVLQPQLAATESAFALWCHGDSTIVTWGGAALGGDSSEVQDQLKGVQQIQANDCAFAAILADGSVVTWGETVGLFGEELGGDSSAVRDQLKGVQQIQATSWAFAAILADGSVVTWGEADCAVTVGQFEISSGVCGRFKPQTGPLLRFWQMDRSSPGVKQTVAVTVRQFEISSGVCGRFRPMIVPLLRFWQMDLSSPGVKQTVAVTVGQFEISSRVCSRFKPHHPGPLLQLWQMDRSSPGVKQTAAETVRQFEISSRVYSRFRPMIVPLLRFWQMDLS